MVQTYVLLFSYFIVQTVYIYFIFHMIENVSFAYLILININLEVSISDVIYIYVIILVTEMQAAVAIISVSRSINFLFIAMSYIYFLNKGIRVKTPCDKFIERSEDDKLIESKLYRSAVGSLVYAMVATRPDLSWSVSKVSQYLAKPTEAHWIAVRRVLRYINSTITHGLSFRKTNDLKLVGYSDSDWGSSIDRRGTTGYCFLLSVQGGAIS